MALVGVVATRFGLGSHYDVSSLTFVPVALTGDAYTFVPGTWRQTLWLTLVPQLLVWPIFTVVAGMAGAVLRLGGPPPPCAATRKAFGLTGLRAAC